MLVTVSSSVKPRYPRVNESAVSPASRCHGCTPLLREAACQTFASANDANGQTG